MGIKTFSLDDASSKQPCVYVIYYMLSSGGFVAACLQAIAKGVLDPRLTWAERALLVFDDPVDLVHSLKTVKGLLLLVPPRTPRSSGYDVYAQEVYVVICLLYVVICYMSVTVICYMSVRQSGVGTWETALYTVRGVSSGSRDVDSCRTNAVRQDRGLQVPKVLEDGNLVLMIS
jgi:hypothetical protein